MILTLHPALAEPSDPLLPPFQCLHFVVHNQSKKVLEYAIEVKMSIETTLERGGLRRLSSL